MRDRFCPMTGNEYNCSRGACAWWLGDACAVAHSGAFFKQQSTPWRERRGRHEREGDGGPAGNRR